MASHGNAKDSAAGPGRPPGRIHGAGGIADDYRERLAVPWWLWPTAAAASAFLATELAIGAPALRGPVMYVVATALAITGVWALSRIKVVVDAEQLHVDDAHLPRSVIGDVTVIDAEARRDLLGPDADPLAFVIQRPWISGGVRIDLIDPADPTPYWFVSSRHPQRLAAALRGGSVRRPVSP